jgi:hypothetical protein
VVVLALFMLEAAQTNSAALDLDAQAAVGDRAAAAVDAYVAHLANEVRMLAESPEVVNATKLERPSLSPGEAAAIDKIWSRRPIGTASPIVQIAEALNREVRDNASARYFAAIVSSKTSVFREILLTDSAGRLVAASAQTEDFDQQDEIWWQQAIARGRSCDPVNACAYVGDVEVDQSVGGRGFTVATPVFATESRRSGVLKVVVDPRELSLLLEMAAANHPITVSLIRHGDMKDSGSDVLGEQPRLLAPELATLEAAQQTRVGVGGRPTAIRALSGPNGDTWAVVVRDRQASIPRVAQQFVIGVIVLVMFLLSVRAYTVLLHKRRHASAS